MVPKLPIKSLSTRVKSPAPRARPPRSTRPTSAHSPVRRSRSHDPDRRPESSSSRYPPSSRRHRSPERRRYSRSPERRRESQNGRHRRRRDSSSSLDREPRRQPRDYLGDHDDRRGRERPSSARYPSPPRQRSGAARWALNRDGEDDQRRRSSTPDKYKPDRYKDTDRPGRAPSSDAATPAAQTQDTSAPAQPDAAAASASSPSPSGSGSGGGSFLNQMPNAFMTYAGLKAVTKHADTAKDWIKWLNDMSETPEEIDELSAKASTARDTITQVQETLKARPDLVEGDKGEKLKEQIEEAVGETDKALGKMTKLLSEISKKGADHGNVVNGMQDFWRSYRYKEEFKDQVEKADEDLQKELTKLSTLMVNIYSRALMKPAPPGSGVVQPPAPVTRKEAEKFEETHTNDKAKPQLAEEQPRQDTAAEKGDKAKTADPGPSSAMPATTGPTRASIPTIVEPSGTNSEPSVKLDLEPHSPPPRSPSAVADEEEILGSPPSSSQGPPQEQPRRNSAAIGEQEAQDKLLDAAWDGHVEEAKEALRHVSHACCDLRGLTPLHLAAERDNLAVAMLLLDRGADIHAQSDGGRTALHLAARSATAPTVEMLLERGKADPNAQTAKGRTPLHYAASKAEDGDEERREAIRVLRDFGADPTVVDREGETARDVAQKRGHWDAAATLKRAERRWEEEHKQNWLQRHGFRK
ncbi:uncharacterized protein F5Z01DRAFT_635135 [Emericellopsis atlantica]|uniref:Uncharacterized protein n=1 Tax=Emericellopsis atlantica TaxID=2614577 RepID=A0A9P7ZNQ5_9HYPO|nr:uncharacterized protein F5Z01DRAFT_635135 [Emericellopsis atlantica]KAG9255504.1 hypothetical protein F5Z01DRAFT_635135 [Emericellopsis atlantica]